MVSRFTSISPYGNCSDDYADSHYLYFDVYAEWFYPWYVYSTRPDVIRCRRILYKIGF